MEDTPINVSKIDQCIEPTNLDARNNTEFRLGIESYEGLFCINANVDAMRTITRTSIAGS